MKTVINISEEAYKYVKENGHIHSRNLVEIDNAIYNSELYEARLKADLKAILVELQLEIEESENCGKAFHLGLQMASNIIQQKINGLKGENEG